MENRDTYFDFLRGVAIVFVVGIHTYGRFFYSNEDLPWYDINILIRQAIGIAVPVFLAISGYFMAGKDLSTVEKYFKFERKQILRVYLPCLSWSMVYVLISFLYGGRPLTVFLLSFVGGVSIYYFIAVIIQMYLLLPILQKYATNKRFLLVSFLITVLSSIPFYVMEFHYGMVLPLIVRLGAFPIWILFFSLGLFFRNNSKTIKPLFAFALMCLSFSLLCLETSLLSSYYAISVSNVVTKIQFSMILFSGSSILFLFSLKEYFRKNFLTQSISSLGQLSFGVYLIHMLVKMVVDKFLLLNWTFQTLLIVVASYAIVWIGKKLLPKFSSKYLGF